jgi:hypothetical protein
MQLKAWNFAVLAAVAALWIVTGTQREKPVVSASHAAKLRGLEETALQTPSNPDKLRELAQAYIDARNPGMAVQAIEAAHEEVRKDPTVEHVYARALIEQGRSQDALAAERRVLERCAQLDPPGAANATPRCSSWLIASATRRADILRELVQLGVEDAQAYPEKSALAYHNAIRQVGLALH